MLSAYHRLTAHDWRINCRHIRRLAVKKVSRNGTASRISGFRNYSFLERQPEHERTGPAKLSKDGPISSNHESGLLLECQPRRRIGNRMRIETNSATWP